MATRDLRDELAAIPGVSDAEITLEGDDRRTARVWLDGTRDSDEVRGRIEALLGRSLPAVGPEGTSGRRSGLGRGLQDVFSDAALEPGPAQLRGTDGALVAAGGRLVPIDRVAVVESHGSVIVEIEDQTGTVFTSTVDDGGSIDEAVLDTVSQLTGASRDTVLGVVDVVADGTDLVVVEASKGDVRAAGAAHVEFGRPYAVAMAAHQALTAL